MPSVEKMSTLNPSNNYQIKVNQHPDEGELGIDIYPPNNVEAAANIDTNTMEIEKDEEDAAATASSNVYSGFGSFTVLPKKVVILLASVSLLGVGVIVGFSLKHNQQQQQRHEENALVAIAGQKEKKGGKSSKGGRSRSSKGGKSAKASNVCLIDDPVDDEEKFCKYGDVACGDTFTNQEIELSGDVFCTDNVVLATDAELEALNAAITLTGPDASIDCKGHSIRQMVRGVHASGCSNGAGDYNSDDTSRADMKEACGLYYQGGIMLVDGATAKNCRVDEFYDGFIIRNGGEVEKSEVSENRNGVFVQDMTGSRETTVSDV